LKTWQTALIWVVCLGAVAGVIAGFGGFNQRTDTRIDVDVGTPVDIGMAEVTITDASITTGGSSKTIYVNALVTNTSGQPLAFSAFSDAIQMAYEDEDGQTKQGSLAVRLIDGDTGKPSPRQVIPPWGEATPVQFFTTITGFNQEKGIRVGLFPVAYQTNSFLNISADLRWTLDLSVGTYWVVTPELTINDQ